VSRFINMKWCVTYVFSWIKNNELNQIYYKQRCPDYIKPGGLTWKIFKFRGKIIEFNGQFLAKSPKFCLKLFFFNKNHNFLKIFAEILLKSQRGDQRKHFWETFLNLFQKVPLIPPLRFFTGKFFQGGYTPNTSLWASLIIKLFRY
jgi:hypothetical protein